MFVAQSRTECHANPITFSIERSTSCRETVHLFVKLHINMLDLRVAAWATDFGNDVQDATWPVQLVPTTDLAISKDSAHHGSFRASAVRSKLPLALLVSIVNGPQSS